MAFDKGRRNVARVVCAGCAIVVLASCRARTEEPAPYAATVAALQKHDEEIRAAFTAGNPEEAHDALHEVAHLLDQFPRMVEGTRLSATDQEQVKQAADELFDAYTELDAVLHGGEEVKYEDVAPKIEANMAVLKEKIAAAGHTGQHIVRERPAAHDHRHDDHDHANDHDHNHDEHDHDHDHDEQADSH